ncbi:hypothetical protein F5Y13DRAFT_167771 [Hypoxylon sp. FL1857]|nr:hypothetical protein F5Y13DRAFT_167771 [Hypoxylon sp. FL1857]
MEFITMVHPAQSGSKELRRQAHSHAARVAHARVRRRRVAGYIHQKAHAHDPDMQEQARQSPNRAVDEDAQVMIGCDASMVLAPRSISGAFEHEPMATFLTSLTYREHLLFSHYIKVVLPYMCTHCPVMLNFAEYSNYMRKNWILFSSTDIDLLRGFLLASSRHLSIVCLEEEFVKVAIQYKLAYLQSLREIVSAADPSLGRIAVSRALVLAFDDIMLGDLPMASKHVSGALHIVRSAGGYNALGLSEFVQFILHSCIYGKRLLDLSAIPPCSAVFMKPESVEV